MPHPIESEPRRMVGETIGRFRVIAPLGVGATGAVYRVYDPDLGRELALETLLRVSAEEVYRLKQEFRVAAGIMHPNLVRLFELFAENATSFFTMELVEGMHLDEYVGGAPSRRSSGIRTSSGDGLAVREFRGDRFVHAMCQVVEGVAHLHAAGCVHRDLKPSNVLVTPKGRAVVLDFGFAVAWHPADATAGQTADVAGTLPYIAPEQLFEGRAVPASDWYSVGALMYELLTGAAPFAGAAADVFRAKRRPFAPESTAALDASLAPLVGSLLDPVSANRPGGARILAGLGSRAGASAIARRGAAFVGRATELAELEEALASATNARSARVACIEGASGIGKSELVGRFLASRSSTLRKAVGRCRPQEAIAYNVFDGAVDQLSEALLQIPRDRRRALWPEAVQPLLRLFPVLRRAHGDKAPEPVESIADPREERRLAFVALRTLIERLAAEAPLAFFFDDVHWGDSDSATLLGSLLNPPLDGPVLFVLAYRSEELATSPFLQALDTMAPPSTRRGLRLSPLSEPETLDLAERLLEEYGLAPAFDKDSMVRESAGSPFLIGELARNVAEAGASGAPSTALDVVGARLDRLSEPERALLETIAIAGEPLAVRVAIEAAASPDATRLDVHRLADLRWLRQTELDSNSAVETYHDRLRERVLQRLAAAPDRLRSAHLRLASALEARDTDPEVLLVHYEAAGEAEAAGRLSVSAAERASNTLAFDRAAELYLRAVHHGTSARPAAKLHELRAEALTNAGRALEAARAFEQAASLLDGPTHGEERLELKRRAGEHYLRTAHYDSGLAIMGEVLRAVGSEIPKSPHQALLPSAVRRIRFLIRGIDFTPREANEVPVAIKRRLDALWSAAISLALLDHQRADPIALTHLLEALDRGECSQALRALGYEAGVLAGIGGAFLRRRSAEMQRLVNVLADQRGVPYERAWARLAVGTSAWFTGDFRRCVEACDECATILREQCRGVSWEIATTEMFSMSALGIMGDLSELERRLPFAMQAAEERGDLFALNNCRLGQPSILWLARGDVAKVRSLAAKADQSMWKGGYHTHRYHYAFAVGQADLHDGDPWSCLARLDEHWPGLKESRLLLLEWPRVEMRQLRARAWLLAARSIRDGAPVPPAHRRLHYGALLRSVEREATYLAKQSIAPAKALALTLRSSVASLRGAPEAPALRKQAGAACAGADLSLLADLHAPDGVHTPGLRHALGVH